MPPRRAASSSQQPPANFKGKSERCDIVFGCNSGVCGGVNGFYGDIVTGDDANRDCSCGRSKQQTDGDDNGNGSTNR